MSKIKLLTLAVVGLLIVNVGLLTFLFINKPMRPPGRGGQGNEGPKRFIIKKLDFDKEQVAAYEQLIDRHQESMKELNEEMRNTKNNLYVTLAGNEQNKKDSLIDRLGALQEKIETVHYNHFAEVEKLCRPDQQDEFRVLTRDLADYFTGPRNPPRRL